MGSFNDTNSKNIIDDKGNLIVENINLDIDKDDQILFLKYASNNRYWELMNIYSSVIDKTLEEFSELADCKNESRADYLYRTIIAKLYFLRGETFTE